MEPHIVFLCSFVIFVSTQFTSTSFEDAIVIISKNYSTPDVTYTELPSICDDCLVASYDNLIIIIQNETVTNKTRTGDTWTTITKDLTNPNRYNLSNLAYNGQSFTQYNNKLKLYAMPGVSSTQWSDLVIFDLETMDYLPYGNYTSFAATYSHTESQTEPVDGDEFYNIVNGTCLTVLNDVLYVIGGYYNTIPSINQTQYETYVFSYNITSDSWSNSTSQLSIARAFAGCASVDNNIYVFGGYNEEPVYSVEKYDVTSNAWTTLDVNISISSSLSNYLWCSYIEYEMYIYCFGGGDFIQIFDPFEDEFVADNVTISYPYNVADPRVVVDNVNSILYVFDNGEVNWQFIELDPQISNPTKNPTQKPTFDPTIEPTTDDDFFMFTTTEVDDDDGIEWWELLLIILGILLGWMIVCCILVYYCRRRGNDETRNGMTFTGVPGDTKEDGEDDEDEEDVEDKVGEFVVSERDHREMVEMMKKQSMSTGLEEVEV